jgi:mono/diheme cytochrome c family protein
LNDSIKLVMRSLAIGVAALLVAACAGGAPPMRTQPLAATGDAVRGDYIATIFACKDCHSVREADGVTLAPATLMAGGMPFEGPWGLVHSANVTEIAPAYNDINLDKVIRGQILSLHVMPTAAYNHMAANDMHDLIAWLRTLKPASYDAPANNLTGEFKLPPINSPVPISATAPSGATVERGLYLVTMGGCNDCHTPTDAQGAPIPDKLLAGGSFSIKDKDGRDVTPPNLTPDKATGLGDWTDAEIAAAIREGKRRGSGQLNPFMPYASAFHAYSDDDVAAVIAYLRSIPAVNNPIPPNPDFEP